MARIRVFIAIEIPGEIKRQLREVQDELRSGGKPPSSGVGTLKGKASFVKAANMHLTLKFLGDIEETALGAISNGLQAAAAGIKPFDLTVGKVEIRSGRVLWTQVEGGDTLGELVKALEDELEPLGYERERRRFRGHLTLARLKTAGAARSLGKILSMKDFTINATFKAKGLTLFKSELTPKGAIYTALREVNFLDAGQTG